jgi:hypothetical protein
MAPSDRSHVILAVLEPLVIAAIVTIAFVVLVFPTIPPNLSDVWVSPVVLILILTWLVCGALSFIHVLDLPEPDRGEAEAGL